MKSYCLILCRSKKTSSVLWLPTASLPLGVVLSANLAMQVRRRGARSTQELYNDCLAVNMHNFMAAFSQSPSGKTSSPPLATPAARL